MSQRWLIVPLTVFAVLAALTTYECVQRLKWVGQYTTPLRLVSDHPSPIRQVSWETTFHRGEAGLVVRNLSDKKLRADQFGFAHDPVRPFTDGTIEIVGRTGGEQSPFGIACDRRVFEEFVILKIEYEDGAIVYDWAGIAPNATTVIHIPAQ